MGLNKIVQFKLKFLFDIIRGFYEKLKIFIYFILNSRFGIYIINNFFKKSKTFLFKKIFVNTDYLELKPPFDKIVVFTSNIAGNILKFLAAIPDFLLKSFSIHVIKKIDDTKLDIVKYFTVLLKLSPSQVEILTNGLDSFAFNYKNEFNYIQRHGNYFCNIFLPGAGENRYFSYGIKYSLPRNLIKFIRTIETYPVIASIGTFGVDFLRFCGLFKTSGKNRGHDIDSMHALVDKNRHLRREAYFTYGVGTPRAAFKEFAVHYDRSRADDIINKVYYLLLGIAIPFSFEEVMSSYDGSMMPAPCTNVKKILSTGFAEASILLVMRLDHEGGGCQDDVGMLGMIYKYLNYIPQGDFYLEDFHHLGPGTIDYMTQGQFETNELEYEDLVLDDEDIQEEDEVAGILFEYDIDGREAHMLLAILDTVKFDFLTGREDYYSPILSLTYVYAAFGAIFGYYVYSYMLLSRQGLLFRYSFLDLGEEMFLSYSQKNYVYKAYGIDHVPDINPGFPRLTLEEFCYYLPNLLHHIGKTRMIVGYYGARDGVEEEVYKIIRFEFETEAMDDMVYAGDHSDDPVPPDIMYEGGNKQKYNNPLAIFYAHSPQLMGRLNGLLKANGKSLDPGHFEFQFVTKLPPLKGDTFIRLAKKLGYGRDYAYQRIFAEVCMGESLEDSDRFYSQFTELYSFEYLDAEIEEDRYEDDYYHEFSYEDMVLEIFLEYDAVPDEEYDPYISDYMDVTTNISSAPRCNDKYKVAHDLFAGQENGYAKCPLLAADDTQLKNNEADFSSENLTSTTTE